MKLKVAILALLAWSPLLLAQDAADSSADAAAEGPRTGYFRIDITPRELLGDDGAAAVGELFPPDKDLSWQLYVPEKYNPDDPPGMLVFVNRGTWGSGKKAYNSVLEEKNLIWIGLIDAGDASPLNERMIKAELAPLVLARAYALDASRIYISGFSGGGHVATIVAVARPELFKGGLFMGGTVPWGKQVPPKIDLVRQNRYVFLVGTNDVALKTVKRTAQSFEKDGVENTELILMQNVRQELPGPSYLAAAIDYLDDAGTD